MDDCPSTWIFYLELSTWSHFLGDAGASLIGFWTAILSTLIVICHPNVFPWFALMVHACNITGTLFTIWLRSIHQGKNPGLPDATHFHSLINHRVTRWATLQ
jgi:UDP-N-acetylmuramyl pentapeptide phosphotransferase/UDP-N-acetylglucosamine-1-phosphate transferase